MFRSMEAKPGAEFILGEIIFGDDEDMSWGFIEKNVKKLSSERIPESDKVNGIQV